MNVYGLLRVICFPWQAYHVYPELVLPLRIARHLQVAARCFTPSLSHLFTFSPLHFVSLPFQRTNRYTVVGAMPLERIWVVASYMFSLAGLSYLSRTHAPFRIARHLQVAARCFTPSFSHLFTFSPLHFCFPALPTDQPLCGRWRIIPN